MNVGLFCLRLVHPTQRHMVTIRAQVHIAEYIDGLAIQSVSSPG